MILAYTFPRPFMLKTLKTRVFLRKVTASLTILVLLLGLSLTGCSRSQWIKTDEQGEAHELAPREQLECAQQVQQYTKEEAFEQEDIEQRIEQCMVDKGYKRRPWWLLNDLHWHLKEPNY